eukprot:SAG31_NODE_203_length_20490_cov_7.713256_17_plen_186_part_00
MLDRFMCGFSTIKSCFQVGPGTGAVGPSLSGRLALAVYSHYSAPTAHPTGVFTSFGSSVIYSDDAATSFPGRWLQSNTTLPFLGEPQLVHLPSMGKTAIMMNARCADRSLYSKGAYFSPCEAQANGSGGYRGVALSTVNSHREFAIFLFVCLWACGLALARALALSLSFFLSLSCFLASSCQLSF